MASSIKLKLCRFDAGQIVSETKCLEDMKNNYIAISHVWGDATWRTVDGVDGEVLVSDSKAKFILEELPPAVGQGYFWMDILCIDQRDDAARVQVVQHIPSIFRYATKTIVIRDGWGVRKCCVDAVGGVDDWFDMKKGARTRWFPHLSKKHFGGLQEGVLERLWPLQEIILSDHIQFLSCEEPTEEEEREYQAKKKGLQLYAARDTFRAIPDKLQNCAQAWSRVFDDSEDLKEEEIKFVVALLTNGSVSRSPRSQANANFFMTTESNMGFRDELWSQLNSSRTTSKPRDFILATMPQYEWYKMPPNARTMSFGELFVDCFEQGRNAKRGFAPLFSSGIIDGAATDEPVASEIPTPACLGDFVKLLRGPNKHSILYMPQIMYVGVTITPVTLYNMPTQIDGALKVIEQAMAQNQMTWHLTHVGEFFDYGTYPECYEGPVTTEEDNMEMLAEEFKLFQLGTEEARSEAESSRLRRIAGAHHDRAELRQSRDPAFCAMNARPLLNALWAGAYEEDGELKTERVYLIRWLKQTAPAHLYVEPLLRLTALISCGVGIGAFDWSARYLVPKLVSSGHGRQDLVMVSKAYLDRAGSGGLHCVTIPTPNGQHEDKILMGRMPERKTLTTVGFYRTIE